MVSQFSGLSGVTLLSAAQSAREPVQFAQLQVLFDRPATTVTVRTAPVLKLTFSAGGVEQQARRGVSISPAYLL